MRRKNVRTDERLSVYKINPQHVHDTIIFLFKIEYITCHIRLWLTKSNVVYAYSNMTYIFIFYFSNNRERLFLRYRFFLLVAFCSFCFPCPIYPHIRFQLSTIEYGSLSCATFFFKGKNQLYLLNFKKS